MKVKVKSGRTGYFGLKRRREGEIFDIETEREFSDKWMEPIGWEPGAKEKPAPKSADAPKGKPKSDKE